MNVFGKTKKMLGAAKSLPKSLFLAPIVIAESGNSNNNTESQVYIQ